MAAAAAAPELLSSSACFGGVVRRYQHASSALGCAAKFSVFLPPAAFLPAPAKVPVLYFLAGIECDDTTFLAKGGAQSHAADRAVALVAPDTSPRGAGVAGEAESWDFGLGAGFYVDATAPPWSQHWRMRSYVVDELPSILAAHVPEIDAANAGISGHSMGGHGALTLGLRHPDRYRSISALAPICALPESPWGIKALSRYLGDDRGDWAQYDASASLRAYAGPPRRVLVDQGKADKFLTSQLQPEKLLAAVGGEGAATVELRMREGYDHGYHFVATFVGEHVAFHADALHKPR